MTTGNENFGHHTKSVVVESYLCFVTSVINPLKTAIEAGEAEDEQFLSTLENMKILIGYLEQRLNGLAKKGDAESIAPTEASAPAPSAPHPASPAVTKWRTLAARQVAAAREIEILRTLEDAGENGVLLRQIQHRLISLGLAETTKLATIATQISRLKKAKAVANEAQGLYTQTVGGAEKLEKMRRNYAMLFAPGEIRDALSEV